MRKLTIQHINCNGGLDLSNSIKGVSNAKLEYIKKKHSTRGLKITNKDETIYIVSFKDDSDIVKMTNCLKDISLYHKWLEINREYKDIDFNSMNIMPSYTDIDKLGAIACSGDQCTIQL